MTRWNLIWAFLTVAALAGSVYFRYRADTAVAALEKYKTENAALLEAQTALRQQISLLKDSDTKVVNLSDGVPKVVTKVYHNTVRQETVLDIGGIQSPPEGQFIQAWAIVKGQPVSLGMVSLTATGSWFPLPYQADAEGFIISQETMKEGNTRPVIELMNGKL